MRLICKLRFHHVSYIIILITMLISFHDLIVESAGDFTAKVSIVINRQLYGPGSKIPKKTKINNMSLSELTGLMLDVDLMGGIYLINVMNDQMKFKFI